MLAAELRRVDHGPVFTIHLFNAWRDMVPGDAFGRDVARKGGISVPEMSTQISRRVGSKRGTSCGPAQAANRRRGARRLNF